MNRVKVTCELRSYDDPNKGRVLLHSHWNDRDKVVIEIGEELRTVVAADLRAALENCTNTGPRV